MKARSTNNYRIELTDSMGNRFYLTRTNGRVQLVSGDMTPHALSNIAGSKAALLSFALADAYDGREAVKQVRQLAEFAKDSKLL